MENILTKIGKLVGSPEKGALASAAVLIALDLMGGSGLFTSLGAAAKITESGLGKSISEALKGALSGYIPGLFERLDKNSQVKKSDANAALFVEATEKCLKEVRAWFISDYMMDPAIFGSADRKYAKKIFDQHIIEPLIAYFSSTAIENIFRNNVQLDPSAFIEYAFDQATDFNSQELLGYKDKKEEIKKTVCDVFRQKFLKQIREIVSSNSVLKDSYHTFLMHQILLSYETIKNLSSIQTENLLQAILTLENNLYTGLTAQYKELSTQITALARKNELLYEQANLYFRNNSLPELRYVIPMEEDKKDALGYSYRNTPYVGRKEILFDMISFINKDEAFLWAMISGPAGQGKSRLAQELCDNCYNQGWHVGFCPVEKKDYKWNHFDPTQANGVLIILDYILGQEQVVEKFLKDIAVVMRERVAKEPVTGKVRVIVLEREFSKDWLDAVQYMDHVSENLFKKEKFKVQHTDQLKNDQKEDLYFKLPQLTDDDLMSLIADVTGRNFTNEEAKIILDKLFEIDHEKRPLIAFILGLYIKEFGLEKEFSDWSGISSPLGYVLDKERHFWQQTALWATDPQLARSCLFITALAQEVSLPSLQKELQSSELVADKQALTQIQKLYEITKSFKRNFKESKCYGFQPDLIAEFYIANHIINIDSNEFDCLFQLR